MKTLSLNIKILFLVFAVAVSLPVQAIELDASTDWAGKTTLALPVSGVIQRVNVSAGQVVKKDAILISLDCENFHQQTKEAIAIVESLKPVTTRARRDLELADDLFDRTVISQVEHDEARLKLVEIQAKQQVAEAKLAQLQWQESHCLLRAPYNAIVLQTHASVGEVNNINSSVKPLVTIVKKNRRVVVAKLTSKQRETVKLGQQVEVKLGNKSFMGKIKSFTLENALDYRVIPSSSEHNNPMFLLSVEFSVGDENIYPAQDAIIRLP